MNFFSKHTGFCAICLALISCSITQVPPPDDALETPESLREATEARIQQLSSARLKDVVLDYFGREERVKLRQLILVKRPSAVRVQTRLPGSEEIMSLLVSYGDTFALHNRKNNKYYTGKPTPTNISRLLPVNLSSRDVVRVMLGGAPWEKVERYSGQMELDWNADKGLYQLTKKTELGDRFLLFFRPDDYGLAELKHFDKNGELRYHYTTDEWKKLGDATVPTYRRFVWPERDLDFSLYTSEIEMNPTLPDSLFKLEPPRGSDVIELKQGRRR
jgi:outer membrane lipoprotein-sorting protein